MVAPPYSSLSARTMHIMSEVCQQFGVPFARNRTEAPSNSTFLGIQLDFESHISALPQAKSQKLRSCFLNGNHIYAPIVSSRPSWKLQLAPKYMPLSGFLSSASIAFIEKQLSIRQIFKNLFRQILSFEKALLGDHPFCRNGAAKPLSLFRLGTLRLYLALHRRCENASLWFTFCWLPIQWQTVKKTSTLQSLY